MFIFLIASVLPLLASAQNLTNETTIVPTNQTATNQTSSGQSPECVAAIKQLDSNCQTKLVEFANSIKNVCPESETCTTDQTLELAKKTCASSDVLTQCMKSLVGKCGANGAGLNVDELKSNCEKLGLPTGGSNNGGNGLAAPIYVSILGMMFLFV